MKTEADFGEGSDECLVLWLKSVNRHRLEIESTLLMARFAVQDGINTYLPKITERERLVVTLNDC